MSGPFAEEIDPVKHEPSRSNRKERGMFDDGYGFSGPSDVGKRGREKERERLRKHEKERDPSDEEDWFAKSRESKPKQARESERTVKGKGDRMSFKFSDKDSRRPADKLEARLSSKHSSRDDRSRKSDTRSYDRGPRFEDWNRGRHRASDRPQDSRARSSGDGSGRQYFGGYGR